MLITPAGTPAARIASARMMASSGVSGAGLSTTVAPAAIAGASFRIVTKNGTFQGTIQPATPTGSRRTSAGPSTPRRTPSNGYVRATPTQQLTTLAAAITWPRLYKVHLPPLSSVLQVGTPTPRLP